MPNLKVCLLQNFDFKAIYTIFGPFISSRTTAFYTLQLYVNVKHEYWLVSPAPAHRIQKMLEKLLSGNTCGVATHPTFSYLSEDPTCIAPSPLPEPSPSQPRTVFSCLLNFSLYPLPFFCLGKNPKAFRVVSKQ